MKYSVYMHIFPNNKVYIGITTKTNMRERWRKGKGYSHNNLMMKAINKYGWENIEHKILYTDLDEQKAREIEIQLIKEYNSTDSNYGYNLSTGGEGATGYKHTPEQIEKAKRNRGPYIFTKEQREKMGIASKKVWSNEEYKKRMKEIHKNRKHKKGYKISKEGIENIKKTRKVKYIKCIETGEIFRGTRDASEKLNIDRRRIMRILRGEYGFKSVKGLHFEYVRDTE